MWRATQSERDEKDGTSGLTGAIGRQRAARTAYE